MSTQSNGDKTLLFPNKRRNVEDNQNRDFWKVLIVDDEEDVHSVTSMVIKDIVYQDKSLKVSHAYSSKEAKAILNENDDFALILLDVVMESDESGLELVNYIRNDLENTDVRIILRTGQPGNAPENQVIINYDINDYKNKTELSSQKLTTSVISALRSYRDIKTIVRLNDELESKVVERTADLQRANDELETSFKQLEEDQKAGELIQRKLLPTSKLEMGQYQFSHYFQPSIHLSGDFLDYFTIDDDHTGFYIADVSGHGVSSAFITVLLKSYFTVYNEKYNGGDQNYKTILNPSELLAILNKEIIKENLGKYLTIFYGVINTRDNTLKYANGGQFPWPFLYNGKEVIDMELKSRPIGLFATSEYEENQIDLPDDFTLTLFSDGILEIIPEVDLNQQIEWLRERLMQSNFDLDSAIQQFGIDANGSYPDDITLLMVKRGN